MSTQIDYVQLFLVLGMKTIDGNKTNSKIGRQLYFFNSWFGVSPFICAEVWIMLIGKTSFCVETQPKHLLWTLFFLKTYNLETTMSSILKADAKTLRKWIHYMISSIAQLSEQVVSILSFYCLLLIVEYENSNLFRLYLKTDLSAIHRSNVS